MAQSDPLPRPSDVDPMRIGVKAGGGDDALHAAEKPDAETTLCGLDAPSRNIAIPEEWTAINWANGCWTCHAAVEARGTFEERASV